MVSENVRVGFRKFLCLIPVLNVAVFCILMAGTLDGKDDTRQSRLALIPDLNLLPKFDEDDESYDSGEEGEGNAVNGNADTDDDDDPDESDSDDTDKDLFDDDNDGAGAGAGADDDDLKPSSSDDGSDDNDDISDEEDHSEEDDDDLPIRPLKKKK